MSKMSDLATMIVDLKQSADVMEVDDELLQDTLESLEGTFTEQVEYLVRKSNEALQYAEVIKAEEKRLYERRSSLEKRANKIKEFIKSQMIVIGKHRFDYPLFTVFVQNNPPSVNIYDETVLPEQYWVEKVDRKPDKKALLEILKNEQVPGCQIERSQSLRIK